MIYDGETRGFGHSEVPRRNDVEMQLSPSPLGSRCQALSWSRCQAGFERIRE